MPGDSGGANKHAANGNRDIGRAECAVVTSASCRPCADRDPGTAYGHGPAADCCATDAHTGPSDCDGGATDADTGAADGHAHVTTTTARGDKATAGRGAG